jgi:general secretion pathway protein G
MELVVTLALLGLIAAMAMPVGELVVQRQREQALRDALRDIRGAIDKYKLASDQGMISRKAGDTGYPPDLETLARGQPNQRSAGKDTLVFIRRIPRDPFNPDRAVPAALSWKVRSSSSPPDNPAPGADVFDVLTSASGVGLNGVPYSEW